MFVADNPALIGNSNRYFGGFIKNDALTTQAAFKARIVGTVNKVLLFVGNFFQEFLPFFHINVAGGAGTNAAAIVIEVHVVFFRQLKNGHIDKIAADRFGRNVLIFE